jgi:hypothetical protein
MPCQICKGCVSVYFLFYYMYKVIRMRSCRVVRAFDNQTNAEVATVLGSIPVSCDTVKSEGRQRKQC